MKKVIYAILVVYIMSIFSVPVTSFANQELSIKEEVIYDIFVDRFNNGKHRSSDEIDIQNPLAYNGGDIKGITQLLDTIEEYGFTAISVSSVFENASGGYHGYWVEDFYQIEKEFGDLDDLKELVSKAHDRGIKVFLELPLNYAAKTNPLTKEADKADWFNENDVTPIPATEWLNEVAVFNQENPEVQQYLIDVATHWMDAVDIDGFNIHAADQSSPEFLDKLATEIKRKNSFFYLFATSLQGDSLDHLCTIEYIDAFADESMFNALNEVFSKPDEAVSKLFETWESNECDRSMLFIDNKNVARFSNNFGDEGRNAVTTWTLALSYLLLAPGTPLIYQGSEGPMYGPGFPENQYFADIVSGDPDIKKIYEKLTAARDEFSAFVDGDFEQVAVDGGFSLFKRTLDKQVVYFGINNDGHSRVARITDLSSDLQLRGLLHDDTIRMNDDGEFIIGMERESAEIFAVKPNVGFNWGFIGFVVGIMLLFIIFVNVLARKQKRRERQKIK